HTPGCSPSPPPWLASFRPDRKGAFPSWVGAELSHASDDPRGWMTAALDRSKTRIAYTQVQWTSACWHPAHFTVQYLSEPTWRCPASCSPATDPQIAHSHPSANPPHFAHSRFTVCPIFTPLGRATRGEAGCRSPAARPGELNPSAGP